MRRVLPNLSRLNWHSVAKAVLCAWAVGLVVAVVQLESWRAELTHSLMQLSADARFRARVAEKRHTIEPAWYRHKALYLLSATEKLDRDTAWTLFIPGSWHVFDDLEERLGARIEREFSEIVVETLHRELHARASLLTGVPQYPATGELRTEAGCKAPQAAPTERRLSAAAEDLPEFVALRDYVLQLEQLDTALQAIGKLHAGSGDASHLRFLVAYTLNEELPPAMTRSAGMFQNPGEVSIQPALMQGRMQWSARCALFKGMDALHARLLENNDLLALERALSDHSARLFGPTALPGPFEVTAERYRAVLAVLNDQHTMLARGGNEWIGGSSLSLGPGHEDVLARIARISVLGPQVLQQLNEQSGAAFADFRRRFEGAFGGESGIVWLPAEKRFGLSPEREALRQGLATLLAQPFMTDMADERRASAPPGLDTALAQAESLAAQRRHFLHDTLPSFPPSTVVAIGRLVDSRVAELLYHQSHLALKAALPPNLGVPLNAASFRQQRALIGQVGHHLSEFGYPTLAHRLTSMLDDELLRRLALLTEQWNRLDTHIAGTNIILSHGNTPPSWLPVGATDPRAIQAQAQQQTLAAQAALLIELGGPSMAYDPAVQQWKLLLAEPRRGSVRPANIAPPYADRPDPAHPIAQ